MVYCSKCGKKNEEDAEFCNKCGAPLNGTKKDYEKEWDKRCEEECAGGKHHGPPIFWGIVVVLIGLWVIFEFVLKNLDFEWIPAWVDTFPFVLVFAALIGIVIIISGIRMITKK